MAFIYILYIRSGIYLYTFVAGFFGIGHFRIKKMFISVRVRQIMLSWLGFFLRRTVPRQKDPRRKILKPYTLLIRSGIYLYT